MSQFSPLSDSNVTFHNGTKSHHGCLHSTRSYSGSVCICTTFSLLVLFFSLPWLGARPQFAVNAEASYWRQFGPIYLDFDTVEL